MHIVTSEALVQYFEDSEPSTPTLDFDPGKLRKKNSIVQHLYIRLHPVSSASPPQFAPFGD